MSLLTKTIIICFRIFAMAYTKTTRIEQAS